MDAKDGWAIASILLCTLANSFLSLAEAALNAVRSSRLQHYGPGEEGIEGESKDVETLQALLHQPTRVVASVQIGITVLSLTAGAIAVVVLAPDLAHFLHRHGVAHETRATVVLLIVIVALLTLVVGEIVPRAVALRDPKKVALLIARPLRWLEILERPLVAVVLGLGNLILRPFGLSASFTAPIITEEELRTLLETSQRQGVIEEDEEEMLRNVISFGDTQVHTVMTPRVDITSAEVSASVAAVVDAIIASGHTRIPLYESTVDNIVGIILAKDLLMPLSRGQAKIDLRTLMRAPYFVPENWRVDDLLEQFRRSNLQMAIVQDEFGGTAGLATIEDLLEEIVGEIQDEYDTELQLIVPEGEGSALVDGRTPISDVNEHLDLSLPTEDYDTIGGYVFGLFGRPPAVGEQISDTDLLFTVVEANGRAVQKVRLSPKPPEDETASETEAAETSSRLIPSD